ncbi:MAG: hypothetical protein ACJA1E_000570 [Paracoccaceae bacterium]|jgi:hypothetical protein
MFTIEHGFDATTVTLVDEGKSFLQEDAVIDAFEDCVTIEQWDARTQQLQRITLSLQQVKDLSASLDLPEGIYRTRKSTDSGSGGPENAAF